MSWFWLQPLSSKLNSNKNDRIFIVNHCNLSSILEVSWIIVYNKSMTNLKRLDHVAILVPDLDQALAFWQDQLGLTLDYVEVITSMAVKIAFLPLGESEIELVQPITDDSGLAKYLAKKGPGLHHICIEVDDISAKLVELKAQGVRLIDEDPVLMDDGRQLAFIHPTSTGGVLLELYELP